MSAWWSWALTIVGVLGIYLTTRKLWAGYVVGVAAQVLWIAYAVTTRQWGFIASAIAYGSVYALGWYRWTRPPAVQPVGRTERVRVACLRRGDVLCDARGEVIGNVVQISLSSTDLDRVSEFTLQTLPFGEHQKFELKSGVRVWRRIA